MGTDETTRKAVTPSAVKGLMIFEAVVLGFMSFWLASEYFYNVYFRIYATNLFAENLTTFAIAIGLGSGVAGTAAAATFYRNLREARIKLGALAPKIKGSVEKVLANVPTLDPKANASLASPVSGPPLKQEASATTTEQASLVATPRSPEEKK